MATIFVILTQANDDSLRLVATYFGDPAGTRTPTNSFGDCDAAITLPRHIKREGINSISGKSLGNLQGAIYNKQVTKFIRPRSNKQSTFVFRFIPKSNYYELTGVARLGFQDQR